MTVTELPTPALLVERQRLEANAASMRNRAAQLGVAFRPHVKTCKSMDVLRVMAGNDTPDRITVSTLHEAEYFFEYGVRDILYAVGIAPAKLDAVGRLAVRGARISVILDDVAVAEALAKHEAPVSAMIEIDSDGHRSGVSPDDSALIAIAEALGPRLKGVLTHAGASYNAQGQTAIAAHAERERAAAVNAAERLRAAGFACPEISVGSTPTATFAANLSGVTELRAGVYVFQDLVQAGLGVCAVDDIALSVLTNVIGHTKTDGGRLVVDAGWMAMSRDRGTAGQAVDQGYGLVCDAFGRPIGDLVILSANQEHGLVGPRGGGGLDPSAFPIGTLLRIFPNHACATAAQHPAYTVIDQGCAVARWPRTTGW